MKSRTAEPGSMKALSLFLVGVIVSQSMLMPVMSTINVHDHAQLGDAKTYYASPHDPNHGSGGHGHHHHAPTPPSCGGSSPATPIGGGGYHSPPSYGSTPPSGGGSYHSPTPPSGGGSYHSPPSYGTTPPPSGGGGYYPPTTPIGSGPPTPIGGGSGSPIGGIPVTPTTPATPIIPIDPGSIIGGPCNFWRSHPSIIFGMFGYLGTMGSVFGAICTPIYGSDVSLMDALTNLRPDGIGALYREGTAALLNSMVNHRFPFTTDQVKNSFTSSLVNPKAAEQQAQIFRLANEGKLKPRE